MQFVTARRTPPMTNTERQRRFRERNPGYYQRLHAKRRAALDAGFAQTFPATAAVEEKAVLCLPAPVAELSIFDLIRDLHTQSEARDAVTDQMSDARHDRHGRA